LILFGDN